MTTTIDPPKVGDRVLMLNEDTGSWVPAVVVRVDDATHWFLARDDRGVDWSRTFDERFTRWNRP